MKNYDDLQRFKEKTQTLDIAFKDMSGQTLEADQSQWAIIRQLAADDDHDTLESGQRIDLPQPQPIHGDEFSAPQPHSPVPPASIRGSILDSLAATPLTETAAAEQEAVSSLFSPAPALRSTPAVVPKATHVERQATTSLFPPPPPKPATAAVQTPAAEPVVAAAQPLASSGVPSPQPAAAPSRFGALFRSRPATPATLSKETLLKPLLEKIALCR